MPGFKRRLHIVVIPILLEAGTTHFAIFIRILEIRLDLCGTLVISFDVLRRRCTGISASGGQRGLHLKPLLELRIYLIETTTKSALGSPRDHII